MRLFTKRLKVAKKRAGLTINEMAAWFGDMSPQTMWSWLTGRIPKPYHLQEAEDYLVLLEKALKRKNPEFPLPISVRQGDRKEHVVAIRKRYT